MINFQVFSLLESILEVDNKLGEVIKYMGKRGDVIANMIYPLIRKDIKTHVNYLRPSTQDDMFFVPDSQVEKTKEKGEELLWQGKSTTKVGRTWRQVLKDNNISFTDSQIETFVNNYKNAYKKLILNEPTDKFEIVSGEEIRKWYHEDTYYKGGGGLNNSCMRYQSCQKYLDIYTKNPEVCQLLILVEDDKLLGRALVWKIKNDEYYLDRIYSRWDSDIERFIEYFEEKFNSSRCYDGGGDFSMEVKLKKNEYGYYPYMDTFNYFDPLNHSLLTSNDNEEVVLFELTSTGGDYESTGVFSDYEKKWIPRGLASNISRYGWVSTSLVEQDGYDGSSFLAKDRVMSVYGYINRNESFEVSPDNWIPTNDLYYIWENEDWQPIPLKSFLRNEKMTDRIPKDAIKSRLSDGRKILVKEGDIISGIYGDPDLYIDEFLKKTDDFFIFYKVDNIDKFDSKITWRRGNYYLRQIGLVNGIPIISQKNVTRAPYIIDQFMEEKYKLSSGKIAGYCTDISEYVKEMYSTFEIMEDKVDFDIYNFGTVDIKYICENNPLLRLYLKEGDNFVRIYLEAVDVSLRKLETIDFNLEDFKNKNDIFFKDMNTKFSNLELFQTIIMHNIFEDTYSNSYINNFLVYYNLPVIGYFQSTPYFQTNIGYQISNDLGRVLQTKSRDTADNKLLDYILDYALKGARSFCFANNL